MSAKPLTKEEKAWVRRVQKALNSKGVSKRMIGYTIGDDSITLYDKDVYDNYIASRHETRDVCMDVHDCGACLIKIYFPFAVESTAG